MELIEHQHINGQTYVPYQTLVDTIVAYGGESHPVLDRVRLICPGGLHVLLFLAEIPRYTHHR